MERPASRTLEAVRQDFPITRSLVYLDNAGVVPTPRPVIDAVITFLREYSEGGLIRHWDFFERIVGDVRRRFGELFGADPAELVPIAHTSEGINAVALALNLGPGDNIVTNNLEFPSNFYPWINLRAKGVEVRVARSRAGRITLAELEPLMDRRTRVVTLTSVAFLNGFRIDVAPIAHYARGRGILTVLDATQALGVLQTNLRALGVDVMACSGMKWLLAPLGTGILYVRREVVDALRPAAVSWLSLAERHAALQEDLVLAPDARRFLLSGNIGLDVFAGLGRALTYLQEIGLARIEERVLALTGRLIAGVQRLGLEVLSPLEPDARSGIVTFRVPDPDRALAALAAERIHVAKRMEAVRVSPHFYNTEDEIDRVVGVLEALVGVGRGAKRNA